jgi:hypothetical protein
VLSEEVTLIFLCRQPQQRANINDTLEDFQRNMSFRETQKKKSVSDRGLLSFDAQAAALRRDRMSRMTKKIDVPGPHKTIQERTPEKLEYYYSLIAAAQQKRMSLIKKYDDQRIAETPPPSAVNSRVSTMIDDPGPDQTIEKQTPKKMDYYYSITAAAQQRRVVIRKKYDCQRKASFPPEARCGVETASEEVPREITVYKLKQTKSQKQIYVNENERKVHRETKKNKGENRVQHRADVTALSGQEKKRQKTRRAVACRSPPCRYPLTKHVTAQLLTPRSAPRMLLMSLL